MNVKDSISATMDSIEGNESGDQSAKNIFSYKPIMGNILKYTVAEYKDCSLAVSYTHLDVYKRQLEKCHGRVELITDVKDVLNLASKLTQYIGLTRVFSNPDIESYEIVCYDAEDYALLKEFLVPVK